MRIKKLTAGSFAGIDSFDKETDADVVLIYGRNEAGKSTVFNMIKTLLYGFSPLNENNSLYPWGRDAGKPFVNAVITDKNNVDYKVHRDWASTKSVITNLSNNTTDKIKQSSLSLTGGMSKNVFDEVYALNVDVMHFPNDEAWKSVTDILLGGQLPFLHKVSEVNANLKDEADKLWRDTKRGKTKEQNIKAEIRNIESELKEARERQKKLHEINNLLEKRLHDRDMTVEKLARLEMKIKRNNRFSIVKGRLDRIDELKIKAGDYNKYSDLPSNPSEYIKSLRDNISEIKNSIEDLDTSIFMHKKIIDKYSKTDAGVILHKNEIINITTVKAAELIKLNDDKLTAANDIQMYERDVISRTGSCFNKKWNDAYKEKLYKLNPEKIRLAVKSYTKLQYEVINKNGTAESIKPKPKNWTFKKNTLTIGIVLLFIGILAMALPLGTIFMAAGLSLLILGIGISAASYMINKVDTGKAEYKDIIENISLLKTQQRELKSEISELLNELPVLADTAINNDAIISDLQKLTDAVMKWELALAEYNNIVNNINQIVKYIKNFCLDLNIETNNDVSGKINHLREILNSSENKKEYAERSNDKKTDIERNKKISDRQLINQNDELNSLGDRLSSIEGDTLDEKAINLKNMIDYGMEMETLQKDFDIINPTWRVDRDEMIKLKNEGESWHLNDYSIITLNTEIANDKESHSDILKQIGELSQEKKELIKHITPDMVLSKLNELEKELNDNYNKGSRLHILSSILKYSDDEFRRENQPDIMKNASRYLGVITDGKYSSVTSNGDNSEIFISGAGLYSTLQVDLKHLSRGTMQQVFLSLRLALAKHLDPSGEMLPICMDEVLINWDSQRLANGLEIINEIKQERQVFLFTCHEYFADIITKKTNPLVIEM